MGYSGRWMRHSSRYCIVTLAAASALLAAGLSQPASAGDVPSVTAAATDADRAARDGGTPVGISTFSQGWTSPWGISFLPGGRSALVTGHLSYKVHSLDRDGSKKLVGEVPYAVQQGAVGLLGVAVSPTWNGTSDKRVFFVHTTKAGTRVVRMSYDGRSLSGYTPILTGIRHSDLEHNGGQIAFGPDGYLYVSTGDALQPHLAQDKNSLNGKILRITKTGAPAPGNPFGNHIYSYGHRNPQGLAWDRNRRLWSVEIGNAKHDELNLIKPGANYGWPTCEGNCTAPGMTNPKATTTPEQGTPAQLAVVNNVIYVSSLRGQRLWRAPIDGNAERVGTMSHFFARQHGRLRALAKVPGANELWLGTAGFGPGKDKILRVHIK
ncbi:PQQ-dependent sugar dehydrogenase [Streptomyces regalis]|uniref:PQQ-dependent sugar dehydrogenase n=1 Tax=Streptomyces regalis TaxID=68262 RepID=UPI00099F1F52|nr:PQQ-dependent sugar dehydrogenase [Streptomyces regalis]